MRKLKLTELGRVSLEDYQDVDKVSLVVVLDNIRSAMNVGSVFRTADSMAIEHLYLCGISATPPNREITKTAIGATDSVGWTYYDSTADAIEKLRLQGYQIIAIEQTDNSTELLEFQISNQKIAIILGNEVKGVSDNALALVDHAIEIAQYGTKHSLNVSVCGGIVIHHFANLLRQAL